MSTELGTMGGVIFTELFDGDERGMCLQLTSPKGTGSIQLTTAQACLIAGILYGWAEKIRKHRDEKRREG